MESWYTLWRFVIFYGHLVYLLVIWYIFPFWYVVPIKIWQPCGGHHFPKRKLLFWVWIGAAIRHEIKTFGMQIVLPKVLKGLFTRTDVGCDCRIRHLTKNRIDPIFCRIRH
jgi:hypothetical protein